LTKWDRIAMMRRIFYMTQMNKGDVMKRGKNNKMSFSAVADMHRAELQQAWKHEKIALSMSEKEMRAHSNAGNPVFSSDESDDE